MNIHNKLGKIIKDIPYELKECFMLFIGKEDADELIKINSKFITEKIEFPITYKNIPIAIYQFKYITLRVIPTKECVTKVYLYEYNNVKLYLDKLEKLCKEYNMKLGGCGCCGSPTIYGLHTINVDNINFENNKLEYEITIDEKYQEILKGEDK